jgi:tetratricopeptide (TPR) repeat protein
MSESTPSEPEDAWTMAMARAWKEAPPPSPAPVDSNERGRYSLHEEIARGGIGVIRRGHDRHLGRDVAIKMLRAEHASDPSLVARFLDEAQLTGQLQHPGVVPIYEMGVAGQDEPWFAMKLVQGQTLAALLKARPDPKADRFRFLEIFEQICQTLAYAHNRGVIHRDLKPANVMVGTFGEVQVVDWGFAKVLGESPSETAEPPSDRQRIATLRSSSGSSTSLTGSVLGTPSYMPPEQARGDVAEIDARSDVFALGAILCEILTGAPPYAETSARANLALATEGNLDRAFARLDAAEVDPPLQTLARHCLSTAREARPAHAGAVAAAMRAHFAQTEERQRAAELSAAEAKVRELSARRARRLTVMVAILTVALLLGGGAWWLLDRLARERSRRERATELWNQLAEARELVGGGSFEGATKLLTQVRREVELSASDERLAASLKDIERSLGRAQILATEAGLKAAREAGFVRSVEELLTRGGDDLDAEDVAYQTAFRDLGVEVDHATPSAVEEFIDRLPTAPRAAAIAALDAWLVVRRNRHSLRPGPREGAPPRESGRGAEPPEPRRRPDRPDFLHLVAVVGAVDADPWRDRLRNAILDEDYAALRTLATDPDSHRASPRALCLLATSLARIDERTLARTVLEEGVARHPGDVWIHHLLATLHAGDLRDGPGGLRLRRYDPSGLARGIEHALTAVALAPKSILLRKHAALLLCLAGRGEEAHRTVSELALTTDDIGLKIAMARASLAANQPSRARTELGMVDGAETEGRLSFGVVLVDEHFDRLPITERLEILERWCVQDPSELWQLHWARALCDRGRFAEALPVLRSLQTTPWRGADTNRYLAECLLELGHYEEALDTIGPPTDPAPPDVQRVAADAWLLRRVRDAGDAGKPPRDLRERIAWARVLLHRGKARESSDEFRALLTLPEFSRAARPTPREIERGRPRGPGPTAHFAAACALAQAFVDPAVPAEEKSRIAAALRFVMELAAEEPPPSAGPRSGRLRTDLLEAWFDDQRLDPLRDPVTSPDLGGEEKRRLAEAWERLRQAQLRGP